MSEARNGLSQKLMFSGMDVHERAVVSKVREEIACLAGLF